MIVLANYSPLAEFFWSTYVPTKMMAADTAAGYAESIGLFDRMFRDQWGRYLDPEEITPGHVGEFLRKFIDQGRAPATAAKHRRNLHAVLKVAKKKLGLTIDLEDLPKPKVPKKLPQAWTQQEFERLLATCAQLEGFVGPHTYCDFIRSVMLMCWCTDWRISAVMAIETARVNLDTGAVVSFERKTSEERIAWLTPQAIAVTRKIWSGSRRDLYGDWIWDRCRRQWPKLTSVLERLILLSGVRDIGRWHCIRKTSTTQVAIHGGIDAAARHAGHSHHSVTSKHYIDPTQLAASPAPLPELRFATSRQLELF